MGGHRVRAGRPRDRTPEADLLRVMDRGLHGVRRARRPSRGVRGLSRRGRDRRHVARGASRRDRASRPGRRAADQLGVFRLRAPARLGARRDRLRDHRDRAHGSAAGGMSLVVDIHHHVIPDFYWEASNEGGSAAGGITPPRWSLDGALAYLDDAGIDVEVPSTSTPGVHFGDDAAARTLARQVNEYLAGIKHDRPDRFGAFAALPLPDVDGSLEQIAYALDVLELDGVSIFTNAGGSYLGDSRFDPIFAELQRRAAVVFVHPTASPDPIAHTLGLPDTLLDYPVDTSRAIVKLHYSNTFARTPDVKYVFVHAGGTIPFLASRFAIVDEMDVIPGGHERGMFADVLPRLYWDTASASSDPVLHMLRSVTGLDTVVFGTDYPYPRDAISIGGLRHIQDTAELDGGERQAVLGGSAARLIPRLARVASRL